jgi:23S rRNA (cytidine1920-2'-O)/16S rRNA (cytidine1409-2'-O)-methyltransferase
LIVDRQVLVNGSFADKPARMVDPGQAIALVGEPPRFVSRAGRKLAGALDDFGIPVDGLVCLDAGSSTGGFTDCLLQRGAQRVVAVDVGTHQLHERLRANPRVDVREQTDIRKLDPQMFDALFDLIVGDLSFISLRLVIPSLMELVPAGGHLILLIKPQFEAGRQEAAKGKGIITDPDIWRRTVAEVLKVAVEHGARIRGLVPSSVRGSGGNVEFVTWLVRDSSTISGGGGDVADLIDHAIRRIDDSID